LHKKGDLSMSTIVMAVIAVLILIILASIVIRNLGDFSEGVKDCQSMSGVCSAQACSERLDRYTNTNRNGACYVNGQRDPSLQCCIVG
jgi:type II secretory pathway pseudopilin PulG